MTSVSGHRSGVRQRHSLSGLRCRLWPFGDDKVGKVQELGGHFLDGSSEHDVRKGIEGF